jgi:hypothetical protein
MMDKTTWAALLSVAFAIVCTVTPIPDEWKPLISRSSWAILGVCLVGWLTAHFRELKGIARGSLPGLSLQMLLRLPHQPSNTRKYLFDFGKVDGERLSVYVSADNIFTVLFIDGKGEPHPIQVPIGKGGFPINDTVFFCCSFGVTGEATFLTLSVDGTDLGSTTLPFRADIGALEISNGVIGADLNGDRRGQFAIATFSIAHSTFSNRELRKMRRAYLRFAKASNGEQFKQLDGKEFGRIGPALAGSAQPPPIPNSQ